MTGVVVKGWEELWMVVKGWEELWMVVNDRGELWMVVNDREGEKKKGGEGIMSEKIRIL